MMRAVLLAVCTPNAVARADSPADDTRVLPCRPTVTCTADLAPPGTLEVELGYQLKRGGGEWDHAVSLVVKLPLARWIELQVATDYMHTPSASHVDNIVLAAKLHVLDQQSARPSIAASIAASIPLPAQPGYTRAYDAIAVAYAS